MSDQNQLNLFEEEKVKSEKTTYLQVILNGEVRTMSLEELFDAENYTELKAVSFVASHHFFFKTTKRFQSVQLILGIEDGHVAGNFTEGLQGLLDIEKRISYFQSLPKDVQREIQNNRFQIRYSKKGTPIHSKIYLLSGTHSNRVIIGSANFTEAALGNQKQYEELLVFDNHNLFGIYQKRFEYIYQETVDFIPEKVKSKIMLEPVNIADPEVLMDILFDEAEKKRIMVELTEAQVEEFHQAADKVEKQKEEVTQFNQVIEVITKVSRKSGKRELLPIKTLRTKAVTIKSKISKMNKKSAEADHRQQLIYHTASESLYAPAPYTEGEEESPLIQFTQKIKNVESLKQQLELINKFIDSYHLFTVQNDPKVQSRIAEAILYAFVSAHIWRMRDHYANEEGRENVRRHVPPFLIIAGRSMSGKTSALEFISMLLGNTNPYMSYEQVSARNMLNDFFHSSNVSPLLIDEIDAKFFRSTAADKGERLIKDITNNLTGPHPVLMGTTNASGFDANAQSSSRIYYLQINNTFQNQKLIESSTYLSNLMNETNPTLYKDFTYRMGEKIKHGEEFYSTEDFLSGAREIFKEYYKECDMPLPVWFPKSKFNDYQERGQRLWRELYKSHSDSFDFRKENTVLVHIDNFSSQNRRDRDTLVNYLPPECINEDSSVLLLNQKLFKEYIEYDKYFKKSIFRRIFK
ncbi:phospholipase D family protein [Planococcus salinus]|uniref:NgoFVII family restriction endonuclease n=1 Tax=Planococcus salinus TaxID=1848460 RepID=A0A3M8P5D7_9BACL|nr:phospholipase D family protein [Planococcus salinus]RNF38865.1 NgoFVII family restriction endonuclease [Planococcus salinus]